MSKKIMRHREGSRKARVHATFSAKGDKAAFAYGRRLGIKETSLRVWFSAFRRAAPMRAAPKTTKTTTREQALVKIAKAHGASASVTLGA